MKAIETEKDSATKSINSCIRIPLGEITLTMGAMDKLGLGEIVRALDRHSRGDWGVVDEDDAHANDVALLEECRLFSAYLSDTGINFWVITEADRQITTVLIPSEY